MSTPSDPILLPPSEAEDSVGTPNTVPPVTCPTSFFEKLDLLTRNQSNKILNLQTALQGLFCSVYLPQVRATEYDQEDTQYFYKVVPDWEGKLLLKGLYEFLRYGGGDEWLPQVTLYLDEPPTFDIKEDSKIVAHVGDQRTSFKAKLLRRVSGQYLLLRREYLLTPFN